MSESTEIPQTKVLSEERLANLAKARERALEVRRAAKADKLAAQSAKIRETLSKPPPPPPEPEPEHVEEEEEHGLGDRPITPPTPEQRHPPHPHLVDQKEET